MFVLRRLNANSGLVIYLKVENKTVKNMVVFQWLEWRWLSILKYAVTEQYSVWGISQNLGSWALSRRRLHWLYSYWSLESGLTEQSGMNEFTRLSHALIHNAKKKYEEKN